MAGAAGLSPTDDLGACQLRWRKIVVRAMPAQLVAVLALERRATHHPAVGTVRGEPLPDRFQPRIAVVVVERLTGGHLVDVGRRVEIVGVGERHPQPLRQRRTDGRLAGARNAHDDDW